MYNRMQQCTEITATIDIDDHHNKMIQEATYFSPRFNSYTALVPAFLTSVSFKWICYSLSVLPLIPFWVNLFPPLLDTHNGSLSHEYRSSKPYYETHDWSEHQNRACIIQSRTSTLTRYYPWDSGLFLWQCHNFNNKVYRVGHPM